MRSRSAAAAGATEETQGPGRCKSDARRSEGGPFATFIVKTSWTNEQAGIRRELGYGGIPLAPCPIKLSQGAFRGNPPVSLVPPVSLLAGFTEQGWPTAKSKPTLFKLYELQEPSKDNLGQCRDCQQESEVERTPMGSRKEFANQKKTGRTSEKDNR